MDEASARKWDVGLKVVGLIGIAIGSIISYMQYFDGVRRQELTAQMEARKPFLAQRQEIYGQAIKAVSLLATSQEAKTLQEAEAAFWALYWGPMATVESAPVEAIMVKIGRCLQEPGCEPIQKQRYSLDLAHTIRTESADTWNVSLPDLQTRGATSTAN
jgi:hypothetical protein